MLEQEIELSIGDTIRIGERLLTVVDLDESEVLFRIESISSESSLTDWAASSPATGNLRSK